MEKYTLEEYTELIELGLKYKELTDSKKILILPCPLGSMVYQVVPECEPCKMGEAKGSCGKPCKKKVMQTIFKIEMIEEYGKTVFRTEAQAIVASVS